MAIDLLYDTHFCCYRTIDRASCGISFIRSSAGARFRP